MSGANLKHCHSRRHHHINGDREPGVSSHGTGGRGPSIRCPRHYRSDICRDPHCFLQSCLTYTMKQTHPKPLLLFKSCSEISLLHIWNVRDAATLLGALLCCTLVLLFPHHREIWTLQATNITLGRECTTFPSSLFHISVSLLQCA